MRHMLSIASLVIRVQDGDRQAYGVLYEHFQPWVYAMALARLRDVHEAQDLTQDVLVHAFAKLHQLRQPAAFPGWLRQIMARMVVNRVARSDGEASVGAEALATHEACMPSPSEAFLSREQSGWVRQGIERLHAMDRATLVAFYYEEQSLETMSREASVPLGTIKRRLHVARKRLHQALTAALE